MNYDLCSGTCLKKSGIYSVAMFQIKRTPLASFLFGEPLGTLTLYGLERCCPVLTRRGHPQTVPPSHNPLPAWGRVCTFGVLFIW